MRIERWYWLIVFCVLSLGLHLVAAKFGPSFGHQRYNISTTEMEVSLETPSVAPARTPAKKPGAPHLAAAHQPARSAAFAHTHTDAAVRHTVHLTDSNQSRQPVRIARAAPSVTPQPLPSAPKLSAADRAAARLAALQENNPTPDILPNKAQPSPQRLSGSHDLRIAGGSAPGASSPTRSGLHPAADSLADSASYGGHQRSDSSLLNRTPLTGGTPRSSVLGSDNPLARDQVDERPGIAPGSGGSPGAGTNLGAGHTLAGLRGKPGGGQPGSSLTTVTGHGVGHGRSSADNLSGDAHGGYGSGHGTGIGAGLGNGAGEGAPATSSGIGSSGALAASGAPGRGTPFGSVAGLLGLGGPGPSRGDPFKEASGGGKTPVHIVYVLDCSGSMRDGNKIGKAKEALKRALFELRPTDTFDIVLFNRQVAHLSLNMMPADGAILDEAARYVDDAKLADGTNISQAMEYALAINGITHVFLMSDGEPNGGISNFDELRKFIKYNNRENAHILTMGLCLGENYKGEPLMRGIADDNAGEYHYINLSKLH